jgi:hypothetical protein
VPVAGLGPAVACREVAISLIEPTMECKGGTMAG